MHNFSATGYAVDSVMASNMSIIETGFNNSCYRHWASTNELEDMSAGATPSLYVGAVGSSPPMWQMSNAADMAVGFYVRRHPEWRYGAFRVVVHYAVETAGDDLGWTVCVTPITRNSAASGTPVSFVEAAPTVAGAYNSVELSSAALSESSLINASHVGVIVSVGRDVSACTNVGDIYIYGVELVYKELRHVIGDKS